MLFYEFFRAVVCTVICPVWHWDTATVDQILIEGDTTYLNALDSQSMPDTDVVPDLSAKSSSLDCSIAHH